MILKQIESVQQLHVLEISPSMVQAIAFVLLCRCSHCDLSIGTRPVKLVDRDSMPYTQAFIQEVFRCGATTPHSIPHRCSADTTIQGQLVPAGKTMIINSAYFLVVGTTQDSLSAAASAHPVNFYQQLISIHKDARRMICQYSVVGFVLTLWSCVLSV